MLVAAPPQVRYGETGAVLLTFTNRVVAVAVSERDNRRPPASERAAFFIFNPQGVGTFLTLPGPKPGSPWRYSGLEDRDPSVLEALVVPSQPRLMVAESGLGDKRNKEGRLRSNPNSGERHGHRVQLVVNGVREAASQQTVIPKHLRVDATVKSQGVNVGKHHSPSRAVTLARSPGLNPPSRSFVASGCSGPGRARRAGEARKKINPCEVADAAGWRRSKGCRSRSFSKRISFSEKGSAARRSRVSRLPSKTLRIHH